MANVKISELTAGTAAAACPYGPANYNDIL